MIDYCARGKEVIDTEIESLKILKRELDNDFENIIVELANVSGKVIIMGVGKSGNIGRKISATMSSLGTPSYFLDPTEAMHGSIGLLQKQDIIIMISNSGNTQELVSLIPNIKIIGCKIIGITQNKNSKLYQYADLSYILPKMREADEFNLAPTSSTAVTLALGDALAVVLSENRSFKKEQFGLYHPGGALGKRLITRVSDVMHIGDEIPCVTIEAKGIDVINEISIKKMGSTLVIDKENKLIGLVTSGDLRRALEKKEDIYDISVSKIMNSSPNIIYEDRLAMDVLILLQEKGINMSVVPVIDYDNRVKGIINVSDIMRLGIMY